MSLASLVRFVTQRSSSDAPPPELTDELDHLESEAEKLQLKISEALEDCMRFGVDDQSYAQGLINDDEAPLIEVLQDSEDDLASSLRAIDRLRKSPGSEEDLQLILESIRGWISSARNVLGSLYLGQRSDEDFSEVG